MRLIAAPRLPRRLFLAGATATIATSARADAWPTRPIRMIVGFPPGGASDIFARLFQTPLSEIHGQPIVVENRPGAGGLIGVETIARAVPDGHTIGWAISTIAAAPALYRRMAFDPLKDLAPISLVFRMANVLVVPAASPYRSLPELLAAARAEPGRITWAMAGGPGSSHHFAGVDLALRAGVQMLQVNYRGGGPATNALLANEVAMGFATMNSIMPHLRAGTVRALAVTGAARARALPDVPSIAELGFAGYDTSDWYGLMAPAGTPPELLARHHAAAVAAMDRGGLRERFLGMGAEPVLDGPEAFAKFLAADIARMAELVRRTGITLE